MMNISNISKFKLLSALATSAFIFMMVTSILQYGQPLTYTFWYSLENAQRNDPGASDKQISVTPLISVKKEHENDNLELEIVPGGDEDWSAKMSARFSLRRDHLRTQCEEYEGKFPKPITKTLHGAFFFSRKQNLLVCTTAKSGASTWKTHLALMAGLEVKRSVHKEAKVMNMMEESEFRNKLYEAEGIIRVISVRNPFSRLVSAYKDKLNNGSETQPFHWRYFRDALSLMDGEYSPRSRVSVPFEIFLRSVLKQRARGVEEMNVHWRPHSANCRPCHVDYNYIVMQETFDEDIRYISITHGIKSLGMAIKENKSEKKYPHYLSYFRDLPDDLILKLYLTYKEDFLLYGYEVPQIVKDAMLRKNSSS